MKSIKLKQHRRLLYHEQRLDDRCDFASYVPFAQYLPNKRFLIKEAQVVVRVTTGSFLCPVGMNSFVLFLGTVGRYIFVFLEHRLYLRVELLTLRLKRYFLETGLNCFLPIISSDYPVHVIIQKKQNRMNLLSIFMTKFDVPTKYLIHLIRFESLA